VVYCFVSFIFCVSFVFVFFLSVFGAFCYCVCVHLCFSCASLSWICVFVGCCVGFVVVVFVFLGMGVVNWIFAVLLVSLLIFELRRLFFSRVGCVSEFIIVGYR